MFRISPLGVLILVLVMVIGFAIHDCGLFRRKSDYFNLSQEEINNYHSLAVKNDADAAFRLYEYYIMCVDESPVAKEKQHYYLQLAARQEHKAALWALAAYYVREKDYDNAIYWYKKLEKGGDFEATIHLKQLGRESDPYGLEKPELYKLEGLADKGNEEAALRVANFYAFAGLGFPNAQEKEKKYLTVSAEGGNSTAQFALGVYNYALYENYEEAHYWFKKAAEQGEPEAKEWLPRAEKALDRDLRQTK